MVLPRPGDRSSRASCRTPEPGPGEVLLEVQRLRRLPHRPAHRRRRADRTRSCRSCRATRSSAGCSRGGERFERRRPRGRALARLGGRRLPLLPLGPREPLRPRGLHRLHRDGGYAELAVADERFCFPIPDGYPGPPGGAAPVRGADRLPRAAAGGRRRAARPLRLRRRRPHHLPGGAPPGPARVRLHARRATRRRQAFALSLGAEWAGDARRPGRPRSSTRALIFAPVGELVPAALRAAGQGRRPSSARGST